MKTAVKKGLAFICLFVFCFLVYTVNVVFYESIRINVVKKYGVNVPGKITKKKFVPRNDPESSSAYSIKYEFILHNKKFQGESLIQSEYYPNSDKKVNEGDSMIVFILNNKAKSNIAEFIPSLSSGELFIITLICIFGNAFGLALVFVFFDLVFDTKILVFVKRRLDSLKSKRALK